MSLDDAWDLLPVSMAVAVGVSRDWAQQANCTVEGVHHPGAIFTIEPNEELLGIEGKTWIQVALMSCFGCPVQWECTAFALRTWQNWGTWGLHIQDLRWLKKQGADAYTALIDTARDHAVPVQVAVANAKSRQVRERKAAKAQAELTKIAEEAELAAVAS
jgi:hypothetical protein